MATLRTPFEELAAQLKMTKDRSKQDEILDMWLAIMVQDEIDTDLKHWAQDPEYMGHRSRARLDPSEKLRHVRMSQRGDDQ